MILEEDLRKYLQSISPSSYGVIINPRDLIFEEAVKMNCFYCGKYGNNWRCPPNLPNIDFCKMMQEFNHGMFVVYYFDITDQSSYASIRNESSVILHKTLLKLEKFMWNHNCPTAVSFIGGSCKLCVLGISKCHKTLVKTLQIIAFQSTG